jgi:hypothetical protein
MINGRYKPKGDGGRIVAINVPDYATAKKIADDLDAAYKAGTFPDESVYGVWGKSHYIVDYHGAFVQPMSEMDDYDKEMLKFYHDVKDYGVKEDLRGNVVSNTVKLLVKSTNKKLK